MIAFWIILGIVVWFIGVWYMSDITDNLDKNDILYQPITILKLLTFIPIIGIIFPLILFLLWLIFILITFIYYMISMILDYWWKGIIRTIKDLKNNMK